MGAADNHLTFGPTATFYNNGETAVCAVDLLVVWKPLEEFAALQSVSLPQT